MVTTQAETIPSSHPWLYRFLCWTPSFSINDNRGFGFGGGQWASSKPTCRIHSMMRHHWTLKMATIQPKPSHLLTHRSIGYSVEGLFPHQRPWQVWWHQWATYKPTCTIHSKQHLIIDHSIWPHTIQNHLIFIGQPSWMANPVPSHIILLGLWYHITCQWLLQRTKWPHLHHPQSNVASLTASNGHHTTWHHPILTVQNSPMANPVFLLPSNNPMNQPIIPTGTTSKPHRTALMCTILSNQLFTVFILTQIFKHQRVLHYDEYTAILSGTPWHWLGLNPLIMCVGNWLRPPWPPPHLSFMMLSINLCRLQMQPHTVLLQYLSDIIFISFFVIS